MSPAAGPFAISSRIVCDAPTTRPRHKRTEHAVAQSGRPERTLVFARTATQDRRRGCDEASRDDSSANIARFLIVAITIAEGGGVGEMGYAR